MIHMYCPTAEAICATIDTNLNEMMQNNESVQELVGTISKQSKPAANGGANGDSGNRNREDFAMAEMVRER